uniref:Uncharacterized protein n=1 Tax=Plectus sambesii TaxID=2011161 RepID=A0A914V2A6_9BILA
MRHHAPYNAADDRLDSSRQALPVRSLSSACRTRADGQPSNRSAQLSLFAEVPTPVHPPSIGPKQSSPNGAPRRPFLPLHCSVCLAGGGIRHGSNAHATITFSVGIHKTTAEFYTRYTVAPAVDQPKRRRLTEAKDREIGEVEREREPEAATVRYSEWAPFAPEALVDEKRR